jgi:hypothetical protein
MRKSWGRESEIARNLTLLIFIHVLSFRLRLFKNPLSLSFTRKIVTPSGCQRNKAGLFQTPKPLHRYNHQPFRQIPNNAPSIRTPFNMLLHECDTCDSVFDTESQCQEHMKAYDHASSDPSDVGGPMRATAILSSAYMSSEDDSDSIVLEGSSAQPGPVSAKDLRVQVLSFLDGSSEGQGVSVPVSALNVFAEPDRSPAAFTEEWVANQKGEEEVSSTASHASTRYKCGTCLAIFVTWEECETHMTNRLHWICQSLVCNRKFDSWNNTSAHMNAKKHWGPEADPRALPSESYRALGTLNTFTSNEIAETPVNQQQHSAKYQVKASSQAYGSHRSRIKQNVNSGTSGTNVVTRSGASNVTKSRSRNQSFKCGTCNVSFKHKEAVEQHMTAKKHHGILCDTCTKTFCSEEAVAMHMLSTGHRKPAIPTRPAKKTYDRFATNPRGGFHYTSNPKKG